VWPNTRRRKSLTFGFIVCITVLQYKNVTVMNFYILFMCLWFIYRILQWQTIWLLMVWWFKN